MRNQSKIRGRLIALSSRAQSAACARWQCSRGIAAVIGISAEWPYRLFGTCGHAESALSQHGRLVQGRFGPRVCFCWRRCRFGRKVRTVVRHEAARRSYLGGDTATVTETGFVEIAGQTLAPAFVQDAGVPVRRVRRHSVDRLGHSVRRKA